MITQNEIIRSAINPAYLLLPQKMNSRAATSIMLSIGFQESGFSARRQVISIVIDGKKVLSPKGAATGWWQFEEGGGVKGVMEHKATSELARSVCHARGVPFARRTVWEALETDDVLAAAFCRLLMWTDSGKLPTNEADGWAMYARTWRPGKPHPDKWPASWKFGLSV